MTSDAQNLLPDEKLAEILAGCEALRDATWEAPDIDVQSYRYVVDADAAIDEARRWNAHFNNLNPRNVAVLVTELLARRVQPKQDAPQQSGWPQAREDIAVMPETDESHPVALRTAWEIEKERLASKVPPASKQDAPSPTHRHKRRSTEYVLIGIGKMQAQDWQRMVPNIQDGVSGYTMMPADMREVAIYRSAIDPTEIWVRHREEFEDGRFEDLRPNHEVK